MSFYREALEYFVSPIPESKSPPMRELKVDREFLSSLVKFVKSEVKKDQDLTSQDQKLKDELLTDKALIDKLNEALKDVKDLSDLQGYLSEDPSKTDPERLDEFNKDFDDLGKRFDQLKDTLSSYLDTLDKRAELEKRLDRLEKDKSNLEKSLGQSKNSQEKDLLEKVLSDLKKDIEDLKFSKDLLERYSQELLNEFKNATEKFADQASETRAKYDDLINQMKSDQANNQESKDQKGRDQGVGDTSRSSSVDRSTDSASSDDFSNSDRSDSDSGDDFETGDQTPQTSNNPSNNRNLSQNPNASMRGSDKSGNNNDIDQILKELADALNKRASGQDGQKGQGQEGQEGQEGQDGESPGGEGPDGDGPEGERPGGESPGGDGSGPGRGKGPSGDGPVQGGSPGQRPSNQTSQGQGQSNSPYKKLRDLLSKRRVPGRGRGQLPADSDRENPGPGAPPGGSPKYKGKTNIDPSMKKHNYPRRDFSGSDKDPFKDASGMGGYAQGNSQPGTDFRPSSLLKILPRQDFVAAANGLVPEKGKIDPTILLATKTYLEALFRSVIKSEYDPVKIKGRFVPVEREVAGHKVRDYARGAYRIQEDFDLTHIHWMLDVSCSMNYALVDRVVDIYIRSLRSILKNQAAQLTCDVVYHSGFLAAPRGALPMKVLKVLGTLSKKLRGGSTSFPEAITDGTNGSEVVLLKYWKTLLANKMGLSSKINAPVFWITDLFWNLPTNFDKTLSRLPILLFLFGHDVKEDGGGIAGNSVESVISESTPAAFGYNSPNSKILLQKMNIVIFVISDPDRQNVVKLKGVGIGKAVPPAIARTLQAALRGKVPMMVSK